MELMPMTLHDCIYKHDLSQQGLKLAIFQLLRGLNELKNLKIVHRDIKPQNTLWDNSKMTLKICDFGSAKKIQAGEESISYIGKLVT